MGEQCCSNQSNTTTNLCNYIGQTVTIYTQSGGCAGSGFTGVLIAANECSCKLLTSIGTAPDCAVGSPCCTPRKFGGRTNSGCNPYEGFGSVTEIPTCNICAFVRNAVAGCN